MECLECKSKNIDFYISSTLITKKYDSTGMTGKQIAKMFNPENKKPYTVKCSNCKEILKKVLKQ